MFGKSLLLVFEMLIQLTVCCGLLIVFTKLWGYALLMVLLVLVGDLTVQANFWGFLKHSGVDGSWILNLWLVTQALSIVMGSLVFLFTTTIMGGVFMAVTSITLSVARVSLVYDFV